MHEATRRALKERIDLLRDYLEHKQGARDTWRRQLDDANTAIAQTEEKIREIEEDLADDG